jgi:hypothetical protein
LFCFTLASPLSSQRVRASSWCNLPAYTHTHTHTHTQCITHIHPPTHKRTHTMYYTHTVFVYLTCARAHTHTQYHTHKPHSHTVKQNKNSSKRVTKMWLTWFFKTKNYKTKIVIKKNKKSQKLSHQQSLHVIDGASVVFPPWVRAPLMRWRLEKKRKKVTVLVQLPHRVTLSQTFDFFRICVMGPSDAGLPIP